MTIGGDERAALVELDTRLKILLPEEYQDSYEEVQPVSMGSAGLKYAADGTVAWDEIWGSFCDLAMAGGPPHKGMLLAPGTRADIDARPERYTEVVDEICRGVTMVTDLPADVSPVPGWCRIGCYSETMAGWLLRAIAMENVAVRSERTWIDLPAAPGFRLEKEIKNVITVVAKTAHYWMGHVPRAQKQAIASLFARLAMQSPLLVPVPLLSSAASVDASMDGATAPASDEAAAGHAQSIADGIMAATGLHAATLRDDGWLGLECASIPAAVWMMRALVADNLLSRREGTVLFVPVDSNRDPSGQRVITAVARIHHLATVRQVA